MATAYKVLGQLAAGSVTNETVYTVPSATEAVVSTITVCNRGTASASYRLAVRPNGTALGNLHYIAYDATVPGNDAIALTLGLSLDAADVIATYASNANLTFNVFGAEITA
jgi:hypothetical protein